MLSEVESLRVQSLWLLKKALPSREEPDTVADSGGVRGVQMHPPLAASNVFLRT